MAVAKRQGRSENQREDFRQNKQNKQHSQLSPICIGQAQVEEKTYKRRSQSTFSLFLFRVHVLFLSLSLSPSLFLSRVHVCFLSLFLSRVRVLFLSLSLSPSLSLSLSFSLPTLRTPLLSSSLWVGMPSRFEDGFSCYLLNKTEL